MLGDLSISILVDPLLQVGFDANKSAMSHTEDIVVSVEATVPNSRIGAKTDMNENPPFWQSREESSAVGLV